MVLHLLFHITKDEHQQPLKSPQLAEYKKVRAEEWVGPENPDGSVNWTCPCLGNGSLVAHRCGFWFRPFYVCAKQADSKDVHQKCANEFVDWNACIRNMNDAQKELMRKTFVEKVRTEKTDT